MRDFNTDLEFPVLLWRKHYSYVAANALELCTHPRSLFPETRTRSQAGEFKLADAKGRVFALRDFELVRPFGGLMRLPHWLMRSVFAGPVYGAPIETEFAAFQATIIEALGARSLNGNAARCSARAQIRLARSA